MNSKPNNGSKHKGQSFIFTDDGTYVCSLSPGAFESCGTATIGDFKSSYVTHDNWEAFLKEMLSKYGWYGKEAPHLIFTISENQRTQSSNNKRLLSYLVHSKHTKLIMKYVNTAHGDTQMYMYSWAPHAECAREIPS